MICSVLTRLLVLWFGSCSTGTLAARLQNVKHDTQPGPNANPFMRDDDADSKARVSCIDCPEYVALPAKEKQQRLWDKITSDEYTNGFPMDWADLITVNFRDLKNYAWNGTMSMFFDRFSDENPTDHAKVIHTYGSVATVRFEPVENTMGYTGWFQEGSDYGVLRLSIVADWTKPCKGGTDLNFDGCFKPSMAIKMLRDGVVSSNTLAQVNLGDGVGKDFNFFNATQGTWLPTPYGLGATVVKSLFGYASKGDEIGGVGLRELASRGSNAAQNRNDVKAPMNVFFRSHNDIKHRFSSAEHDVRADFKQIEVGSNLYDVVAVADDPACRVKPTLPWNPTDPVAAADLEGSACPHAVVGRVVSTSRFVASAWGDRRLFFQHERLKTHDGDWKRQACEFDNELPDSSEYRMSQNPSMTCTHECKPPGRPSMTACPYASVL